MVNQIVQTISLEFEILCIYTSLKWPFFKQISSSIFLNRNKYFQEPFESIKVTVSVEDYLCAIYDELTRASEPGDQYKGSYKNLN